MHWGYELTESDLLGYIFYFFVNIIINYYWLNSQALLQKAENKYHNCDGKEKATEYYQANKDVIKRKASNKYKNLKEEEKKSKNTIFQK